MKNFQTRTERVYMCSPVCSTRGWLCSTRPMRKAPWTLQRRNTVGSKVGQKNVNLFDKNLILFPICEHSHWFLIIAVRPHLATLQVGLEDRHSQGKALIIVLDSLGRAQQEAVSNICLYLAEEWKMMLGSDVEYPNISKNMRIIRPEKPEQINGFDCGIYLLLYVEKIFQRY